MYANWSDFSYKVNTVQVLAAIVTKSLYWNTLWWLHGPCALKPVDICVIVLYFAIMLLFGRAKKKPQHTKTTTKKEEFTAKYMGLPPKIDEMQRSRHVTCMCKPYICLHKNGKCVRYAIALHIINIHLCSHLFTHSFSRSLTRTVQNIPAGNKDMKIYYKIYNILRQKPTRDTESETER